MTATLPADATGRDQLLFDREQLPRLSAAFTLEYCVLQRRFERKGTGAVVLSRDGLSPRIHTAEQIQ